MGVPDAFNATDLENLARTFVEGSVVGLVGAGTSIACGYPGWNDFLEKLANSLLGSATESEIQQLREGDVRVRLDGMAERLGKTYSSIFRDTFAPRDEGGNPPEWVRLILDLPFKLLLTTNYTTELEQVARSHPSSPLGEVPESLRWHERADVARAIKRTDARLRLIYLHGRFDDDPELRHDANQPWHVILGEQSYQYAYEQPGINREWLKAIGQTSTLLIIGASLQDEDLTGVLRSVKSLAPTGVPPHYAVLPLHEKAESMARDVQRRYGLQSIFYPLRRSSGRNDHGAIEDLLRSLVTQVSRLGAGHIARAARTPGVAAAYPRHPRVVHSLLRASRFEPRPVYQRVVHDFLSSSGGGVLALVGIGGCGKTALARDALDRWLSGPGPIDGLFAWNFDMEPDAARFFVGLAEYLQGEALPQSASEQAAFDAVRAATPPSARILVILDGLERLQLDRPDERDVHGSLQRTRIGEFLLWLAQTRVAARALVTTRFALPELESEIENGRVRLMAVGALTRSEARSLLRKRGVRGKDDDLDRVLDHFGAHALTVDHLGAVLVTYLNGDPSRFRELGEGSLTRFDVGETGRKLGRVLTAYKEYLQRHEPELRDTLQRAAIFPRPVSRRSMADVYLRAGRERSAGSLARKTEVQLEGYLQRLVSLGLLHREDGPDGPLYGVHAALRDVVAFDPQRPGSILAAAREEAEESLDALLHRAPEPPKGKVALDLAEDLFGFYLDEENVGAAARVYFGRMGSYQHLSAIGEHARGERITRRLHDAVRDAPGFDPEASGFLPQIRLEIPNQLALFLSDLGRVREAIRVLQAMVDSKPSAEFNVRSDCLNRLAEAQWRAGRLPAAESAAEKALAEASQAGLSVRNAHPLAVAAFSRGRIETAFPAFAECLEYQRADTWGACPWPLVSLRGFDFQMALVRCGRPGEALRQAEAGLALSRELDSRELSWSHLAVGETMRVLGRHGEADSSLRSAHEWAIRHDHQWMLLFARLFLARAARDADDLERARIEAETGLREAEVCGCETFVVDFRSVISDILRRRNEKPSAIDTALRALAIAESSECDYFWGRLDANELLGEIYRDEGDVHRARACTNEAARLRARGRVSDALLRPLLEPPPGGKSL